MPFGTVLGVFTIIVLMRESVREMFAAVGLFIEAGQFSVNWSSVPAKSYRVLYSPHLVTWILISDQIPAGWGEQTSWSELITPIELRGFHKIEAVQ